MISYKTAIFIFSCFIAGLLITYRIYIGHAMNFSILGSDGISSNGTMLFWLDEITYLTWLDTRGDTFFQVLSGERDATNLFGYFVGFAYLIFGGWEIPLFIGILGLWLFYLSAELLIKKLPLNRELSQYGLALFMLCPTTIMLSSGVLRDIYVLAVVNLSIYFAFNHKIFSLVLCMAALFFLRNFYIALIFPTLVYFYFFYSKNRHIYVFSSCVGLLSLVTFAVLTIKSLYSTGYSDLFFRVVNSLSGINIELMRPVENFSKGLLFSLEYLGNFYQFIVTIVFYLFIIKNRFKVHSFILIFIVTGIALGIIYGHFLGYFVSRTKLILLWMIVLYFMLSKSHKIKS